MEKIKVFVCEDHPIFKEGIKSYLGSRDNIEIVGDASNGAQLIHMLNYAVKFPDIIVLDINMPIMTGEEALPIIKEKYPELKVLMLSMHNDIFTVSRLMTLGANGFVTKADALEEVHGAIDSIHKTGYYFNSLVNTAILNNLRNEKRKEKEKEIEEEKVEEVVQETKDDWFIRKEVEEEKPTYSFRKDIIKGSLLGLGLSVILVAVIFLILYFKNQ